VLDPDDAYLSLLVDTHAYIGLGTGIPGGTKFPHRTHTPKTVPSGGKGIHRT
jgi:hypothetical protein